MNTFSHCYVFMKAGFARLELPGSSRLSIAIWIKVTQMLTLTHFPCFLLFMCFLKNI